MEKIKVVWICYFSNAKIRERIPSKLSFTEKLARKVTHKTAAATIQDSAVWNTNGIHEFEKFKDIELHVISPCHHPATKETRFDSNGIHYYFFADEADSLREQIRRTVDKRHFCRYKKNRRHIASLIREIAPHIVHVIGAENPNYAWAITDISKDIPTIVQLQTLMSAPDFFANYHISKAVYEYRSKIERKVIQRADYIGTTMQKFRAEITKSIKPEAVFLSTCLALTEPIDFSYTEKVFDFVYFAGDISKAADYAIEAFAIAHKTNPAITLDIIGGYNHTYKALLDTRISELGLNDAITFEGCAPTHDELIRKIKRSRFALLPLKIDIISGTIRESMACGLPVVTTITPGTPALNKDRESVLLSPIGDHQAMADNMLKLSADSRFAALLRDNAGITSSERASNEAYMRQWAEGYKACIAHFRNGTPLPENIVGL